MSKIDKKRKKILSRIEELEAEMFKNIKQKVSDTAEISIFAYQTKIADLRKQLEILK